MPLLPATRLFFRIPAQHRRPTAPAPPPGLLAAGPVSTVRDDAASYSTGISLLIRLRSMPCLLRMIRADTNSTIASTYMAPM